MTEEAFILTRYSAGSCGVIESVHGALVKVDDVIVMLKYIADFESAAIDRTEATLRELRKMATK